MEEIWKDYPESPDTLMVSNMGRVHTKDRYVNSGKGVRLVKGKLLKPCNDKDGYKLIGHTYKDGRRKTLKVHRLVLQTFSPIENMDKMDVNHKDGDKENNELENLEWVTHLENIRHAIETGLTPKRARVIHTKICINCSKEFSHNEKDIKYCSVSCSDIGRRKSERPSSEELYEMLTTNSFSDVGKLFNVSDNAIRKWCKQYNIPHKSTYYRELRNKM